MLGQEKHIIKGSARFRPNHFFASVRFTDFRGYQSAGLWVPRVRNCHSLKASFAPSASMVKIANLESSRVTAGLMLRLIANRRGPIFWQLEVPDTSGFLYGIILLAYFLLGRRFVSRELLSNLFRFVHCADILDISINASVFSPIPRIVCA